MPAPYDCSGGQGFSSKGGERIYGDAVVGLVRRAWGCPSIWKFARPSPKLVEMFSGDRGGTPNHRGLVRLWDWGSAMEEGKSAEACIASGAALLDFFEKQFTTEGIQWAEETTTSHPQLWILIGAAARALALKWQDDQLLEATGRWWRMRAWLDDLLIEDDGHWDGPGGRSAGPTADILTVAAHQARGTGWPRASLIRGAKGQQRALVGPRFYQDVYNVGVWMMRELIVHGDDLGGVRNGKREEAVLRDELHIYRRGSDYLKVYPVMHSSDAMFWTARIAGIKGNSGISSGRFPDGRHNPFPTPVLSWSSVTVVKRAGDKIPPVP